MNKTDPLFNQSDRQKDLFEQFSKIASGRTVEDAVGAGSNIIINAIRQTCPKQTDAEKRFDELFGRMKQILMDHYNNGTRKNGVFPYHQFIEVPYFDLSTKQ